MAFGAGAHRKSALLPRMVAAGIALAASAAYFETNFASFSARPRVRQPRVARADAMQKYEQKWQAGIDAWLFDDKASIPERINGIQTVWQNRHGVHASLKEALSIVREKGDAGRAEALDTFFPSGSHARADVDFVLDMIKSLRQSTPDLAPELEKIRTDVEEVIPKPVQDIALGTAKMLLPIGVDQASFDAADIFRDQIQDAGKEVLSYLVVKETRTFEIRAYQPYTSVKRKTSSMSQAFTDLAKYIQAQQKKSPSMRVAMPIATEYSVEGEASTATGMTFALQSKAEISKARADPSIEVKRVPMQFVAVRRAGATDADAQTQAEELRSALESDGAYMPFKESGYSVMQYYLPRALPLWRRKTEVAIPVKQI